MKHIILILSALFSLTALSQSVPFEKAPGLLQNGNQATRDTFNLQFSFPTSAFIGEYGIESDGEYIYVTQWRDDSIAKYDLSGNVLHTFVIPGVGEVRDLAWDGQYFYGSPNDYFYYILDLDTKTLIGTVPTDIKIRGMAYDSDTDALWASQHWSPAFYRLDKEQGTVLDSLIPSGITLDAISGLAYDNFSPGGPFLWGFSQDSTGAIIIKYDIPNQKQTGNMIDVSGLITGAAYAGGLFIESLNGMTGMARGGMIQNEMIFGVDIVETGNERNFTLYPNPVSYDLNLILDNSFTGSYTFHIFNLLGQNMMEFDMDLPSQSTIHIDIRKLENGIYFLKLSDINGTSISKSFIKTTH